MTPQRRAVPRETQQITTTTDSREILANARADIERYGLDEVFVVDVDAHHVELDSWAQILEHIENPVLRATGQSLAESWPYAANIALSNHAPGLTLQDVGGRIPHQAALGEATDPGEHRDLVLVRRAMDSMGIDVQVVFPQPLLDIGLHPSPEIATELTFAYNRWFTRTILPAEPRIKALIALPFHDPGASLRMIREFAEVPGVIGFMVTSQRQVRLYENAYAPVYAELQDRGLPLAFHAGPSWADTTTRSMNRFMSVHALSFVTCNMTHLTNWIVNGLPERFPHLRVVWVESGLAWLPFMMQRLDHEYLMRQSDAPLLKRLPSEYMREMYYTTQPMEVTDLTLLEATFDAISAKTQLMYSSDWPHWDFDVPSRIASLPFLDEKARDNILGGTACRVFNL
ncbi:amidohydrolase [Streptomyces sp. TR1341]|uniref:amidohydrolase family protein n=1 Tax=Streptomyces sp. TR1341 TaxID=2601266 RepID=UPI00138ACD8A|nr:amidohydrolase [Streptomyces sp. TR1341]